MDIFILAFDRADVTVDATFIEMMFYGIYQAARQHLLNEVQAKKATRIDQHCAAR